MSTEQIDFNRWSCGTAAGLSGIEPKVSTGRLQSLTHNGKELLCILKPVYYGIICAPTPPFGGRIFGKLKAMEHHASPPSSLIWLWLLVSFGEPLVTFLTTLSESWSDYRKEVAVLCAVVVHHSRYFATSAGGVEGLVLLLSSLGGRYSVLGHLCHNLVGVVTTAGFGGGRVKLMLSCARQLASC